jgi:hypothetical protein
MQDRPDARELLEAVIDFLDREVNPALTDPRLRFRGLVAANVLKILTREIAAGDVPLYDEWRRLKVLLGHDDSVSLVGQAALQNAIQSLSSQLCSRIRALPLVEADNDPWYNAAFDYAEQSVIEKLKIANPRYLERVLHR